ncbi:MAG: hypothetical protein ACE5NN_01180 [Candidatus Bathyarchaeia archaeon]
MKKEVYARVGGKCEGCGLRLKWGGPRIVFHHIRSPTISPTAKTVQLLCRNCHAKYGHKIKTVTHTDILGFKEKETKIKRRKVKIRKPKKTTAKKKTKTAMNKRSSRTAGKKTRKKR